MVARPRPNESSHYELFWQKIAQGVITVDVCSSCNCPLPYGTLICKDHGLKDVQTHEIAPTGQIVTSTRIERHPHPLLDKEAPYAIGVVREDRFGALIYCRIEAEVENPGGRVEIRTKVYRDGVTLIVAVPLDGSSTVAPS